MSHSFVHTQEAALNDYWQQVKTQVVAWKAAFEWPKGVHFEEAVARRDALEKDIKTDLQQGYLTKATFDAVMKWGFGRPSKNEAPEIEQATRQGFQKLAGGDLEGAALALCRLKFIGISSASKVLALADQARYGVYDSRIAHGLSDLVVDGKRALLIPPGRVVAGDVGVPNAVFCAEFAKFNALLAHFHALAQQDAELKVHFSRVSDLEIAFFARSRSGLMGLEKVVKQAAAPTDTVGDEVFHTLGQGTPFWATVDEFGIRVWTGPEGKSKFHLSNEAIEQCLGAFEGKGWVPLGHSMDAPKPGGLGEYFRDTLKQSPMYATHAVAVWASQGRVETRKKGGLEVRVL